MDRGSVIKERIGIIEAQIRKERADADAADGVRVIFLNGGGSAYEIERHAEVHAEMPREVAANRASEVIDRAVRTAGTFETDAQGPAGGKA